MGIPKQISDHELADLRKSEAGRLLLENVAQLIPGIGPFATAYVNLLRFSHRSELQKALDKQFGDTVESVIDHEARLSLVEAFVGPRLRISTRALALGKVVSERSAGVFGEAFPCADLRALTELSQAQWEEAIVEFKHEQYADLEFKLLRPQWRAFATFDPLFHGTDPVSDAAVIANIAADATAEPTAESVAETTKLPERQFNPAMQFLSEATNGGVRRTINGDWCFLPTQFGGWRAEDRYRFRRVSENAPALAINLLSSS